MSLDPGLRTELMELASRAGRPLREIVVVDQPRPVAHAQRLAGDRLLITSAVSELPMDEVRAVVALAVCRRHDLAGVVLRALACVGVFALTGYLASIAMSRLNSPLVPVVALVLVLPLGWWMVRAPTGAKEAAPLVGGPDALLNAAARVAFHNASVRGCSRDEQRRMAYRWLRPMARDLSVPGAELDAIIKHCGG